MGERKGRIMKRGCFEEPGTGSYDWLADDVMEYAFNQLTTTVDWTGVRFSTNHEDDNEIAHALSTRPEEDADPELLAKQIGHCRAVGALEMALRAASKTGDEGRLAAAMIPSLIEQYLMDCPIGEFAPVGRGGAYLPFTKMMALVVV